MIGKITAAHHQTKATISRFDQKISNLFNDYLTTVASFGALANIYLYGQDASLSAAFQNWGVTMGLSFTVFICALQWYECRSIEQDGNAVPTNLLINKWVAAIGVGIAFSMSAVYFGLI